MDIITSHREALKWAADLLEMIMAAVTDEQAHWMPLGIANPLGATYAHALVTSHTNNMAGEISALKGIQGAKGYPF